MEKINLNQVCLRTLKHDDPFSLSTYIDLGGYDCLKEIVTKKIAPEKLLEEIKISNLRGRGGAAFPTAVKLNFLKNNNSKEKYIICNSDEGEPGTFKDRDILLFNPHQLIEGMIIVAYIVNANKGYNYIRGEFFEPLERIEKAIFEAKEAGFLGNNIFESDFNFELNNISGAGSYICGEETALIESIEGNKGNPRFKPPFPANCGLYSKPTNVNNTETYASIPVILKKGGDWYLNKNSKNNYTGYKIFSISGCVNKPGNYEVPFGTLFKNLIELAGGVQAGKKIKAVIPGGVSAPVLPYDIILDLKMDYDSLEKAGSMIGSGGIIVISSEFCMVKLLGKIINFFYDSSCGQCSPCREGVWWIKQLLEKILKKKAKQKDLDLLLDIANEIRNKTICSFTGALSNPIISFLQHFRSEFENYIT